MHCCVSALFFCFSFIIVIISIYVVVVIVAAIFTLLIIKCLWLLFFFALCQLFTVAVVVIVAIWWFHWPSTDFIFVQILLIAVCFVVFVPAYQKFQWNCSCFIYTMIRTFKCAKTWACECIFSSWNGVLYNAFLHKLLKRVLIWTRRSCSIHSKYNGSFSEKCFLYRRQSSYIV